VTRTYRYDPTTKKMVEVRRSRDPRVAPAVFGDLPDYESPIDGRLVSGRKGRRDDLKRHGCRPWEGLQAEKQEAARQLAYEQKAAEMRLEAAVRKSYAQLHPDKRRVLENR
jgi:hypothetical protein